MYWLLFASLFFYGWWNPKYLFLLVSSIAMNYGIGSVLGLKIKEEKFRFAVLVAGVSLNLVLIGYYKYYNFFIESANTLFGTEISYQEIFLPLAISFFTFQQIAYLVDAYRREVKAYTPLQYSVFVSFFPQLIAGPIVHHHEVIPQFSSGLKNREVYMDLSIGSTIFFIGLFKKVLIADNFALLATPVFTAAEQGIVPGIFQAWQGAVSYSFQLYFDFSGYSDMAIGLARMFGIQIPLNFHSPYRATGIIDFWRRWHITLSRFLRNYLYFPLGGNRKGPIARYRNLMITMLLGGLWHGAGWTFVLWGGLHGIMLVINHFFRAIVKHPVKSVGAQTLSRIFTFICVTLAWVFFRAESLNGALVVLKGMINLPHTFKGRIGPLENILVSAGFQFQGPWVSLSDYLSIPWLIFWMGIVWFWPNTQEWMSRYQSALNADKFIKPGELPFFSDRLKWHATAAWGLAIVIIGIAATLHLSRPTEFLYFQF